MISVGHNSPEDIFKKFKELYYGINVFSFSSFTEENSEYWSQK